MSTVTNVSAGKPAIGGAVNIGPITASLPTDAVTSLSGFTNLGYCSEDGMTNSNAPSMSNTKAWGGDIVLSSLEEKPDTFQFTLIEVLNPDVLAAVYGSGNVTGTLATGIAVSANSEEPASHAWVVDTVMRGGVLKRFVVPNGMITDMGDIVYNDTDAVGYEVTITAFPDSSGNTHYEYIIDGSASS